MELPGCERDRYKDLVPKVMGKDENCCAEWARAKQRGTDNEMYGALIWDCGGEWRMGCELPTPRYCPWCGARRVDA